MIEKQKYIEINEKPENAIAISVFKKGGDRLLMKEYLDELCFLAETAGANVIATETQELNKPHVATYIGKGKVQEIKQIIDDEKITLAIFDDELSPVQIRNLELEFKIKILDRSGLILDIFAARAQTKEAKTQVELAQLQYLLPRLTRMWTHLSKQYGGVGTKGPGETQIEVDRRLIRKKIDSLKVKLEKINDQSKQKRKKRNNLPTFALVGYTNAGKSTLMKAITKFDTYIEDKLFATLDTTTRVFELPSGQEALLSDTVGFIRKLPAHLIASFRSTLAEAEEADFLVHVIDVSNSQFKEKIDTVKNTLKYLKIDMKPTIMVFNKIDLLEEPDIISYLEQDYDEVISISAKNNIGLDKLLYKFQDFFDKGSCYLKVFIPYSKAEKVNKIYKLADVLKSIDNEDGHLFELKVQSEKESLFKNTFEEFILND